MAIKIKSKKFATDEVPEVEVPEIEEVQETPDVDREAVPDVVLATPAKVVAPEPVIIAQPLVNKERVRISVFREISPSPRIGNFSFTADMDMPVLKPGNYDVPYDVAIVLVDKRVAMFC